MIRPEVQQRWRRLARRAQRGATQCPWLAPSARGRLCESCRKELLHGGRRQRRWGEEHHSAIAVRWSDGDGDGDGDA